MKCTKNELAKMLLLKEFLRTIATDENLELQVEIAPLKAKDFCELAQKLIDTAEVE